MAPIYLLFLLLLVHHSTADPIGKLCEGSNYSANSIFRSNLNFLLSSLSLSSANSTFSNITEGSIPDRAYGLFLCRGDISLSNCSSCVQTATQNALQICPSSKQVTIWYDTCQLRYSYQSFFSSFGNEADVDYPVSPNATDPVEFSKNQRVLMSNLSNQAAYNSSIMFATGEILHGGNDQQSIYGLVKCTRDLSGDMCSQCLDQLLEFYQCCDGQIADSIVSSCSLSAAFICSDRRS